MTHPIIAVIIPCLKTRHSILNVISSIPENVEMVYVVDDGCPEKTGEYVKKSCQDRRVKVLTHQENQGVGGAVTSGYKQAINDGAIIIVKVDGDGQMNPALIPKFIEPILSGKADYVKGNRFFSQELLAGMPGIRKIGNTILSFIIKGSSGYWNVMDPTNGYTAIHSTALKMLPLHQIDKGYFFESDMLFRLNVIHAVVVDLPMRAKYDQETSHLRISRIVWEFPGKCIDRFLKRIVYNYFLHDFNIGSFQLLMALFLITVGSVFGLIHWFLGLTSNSLASSGTVMLAALPIILGFQSLLSAINYDVSNIPQHPIHLKQEEL